MSPWSWLFSLSLFVSYLCTQSFSSSFLFSNKMKKFSFRECDDVSTTLSFVFSSKKEFPCCTSPYRLAYGIRHIHKIVSLFSITDNEILYANISIFSAALNVNKSDFLFEFFFRSHAGWKKKLFRFHSCDENISNWSQLYNFHDKGMPTTESLLFYVLVKYFESKTKQCSGCSLCVLTQYPVRQSFLTSDYTKIIIP